VDDITAEEVRKIAEAVAEAAAQDVAEEVATAAAAQAAEKAMPTVYQTLEDVPEWYRPTVQKLVDKGILKGTGGGALNVDADQCWIMTWMDRLGALDLKEQLEIISTRLDQLATAVQAAAPQDGA